MKTVGDVVNDLALVDLFLETERMFRIEPGDVVDLDTFQEPWRSSVRMWGGTLPHAVGTVISVVGNEATVLWSEVNPQAESAGLVSVGTQVHPTSQLVRVGETSEEAW